MRSSALKALLALAIFVAAVGITLAVLSTRSNSAPKPRPDAIWGVGDKWTIKVAQDSAAITPNGATSVAEIPYRFAVVSAPAKSGGEWKVRVTQDGAEGAFADGWTLWYREKGDSMTLVKVQLGTTEPADAEMAPIVLGMGFPYETTYKKRPKSGTVQAEELAGRTGLPPSELPEAPPAGDMPPGSPPPPPGA